MDDPKKRLAALEQLTNALAADVAAYAQRLDTPPSARDPEVLDRDWRAIAVSHRALKTMIKGILADSVDPRDATWNTRRATRALVAQARAVRRLIQYWPRINPLMERQFRPEPSALFPDRSSDGSEDVMDHVSDLFIDALHKVANPAEDKQSDDADASGMHRDIPLPMVRFADMLGAAYRLCLAQRKGRDLRFLDVGSGGGTKVLAATTCFETCHGLEYEAGTVAFGARLLDLLGRQDCTLIQGNAFTFADYGTYDAIYFYRPMRSAENMIAMEAHILAQTRPGTVLMVPGGLLTPDPEAGGVQHINRHVYVTGMSETEASALHGAARDIGTGIRARNRRKSISPGLWEPLLEASHRNGYRL